VLRAEISLYTLLDMHILIYVLTIEHDTCDYEMRSLSSTEASCYRDRKPVVDAPRPAGLGVVMTGVVGSGKGALGCVQGTG